MEYKLYIACPLDWWDITILFYSIPVISWAQENDKGDALMEWLVEYFDGETPSQEEVQGALLALTEENYKDILGRKVG